MKLTVIYIAIFFPVFLFAQKGLHVNGGFVRVSSGAYISSLISGDGVSINSGGKVYNNGRITTDGNWVNNAGYSSDSGTVVFTGFNTVVNGNSTTQFHHLTINKTSNNHQIVLKTGFSVNGILFMQRGDIYLHNQTVSLGTTGSLSNETNENRIYDDPTAGTGKITVSRNNLCPTTAETFGHIGLQITSDQCLGNTMITRSHSTQIDPYTGNQSISRFFEIVTDSTGVSASVQFHYFDDEIPAGYNEDNFILYRSENNGISWQEEACTIFPGQNYITKSGLNPAGRLTLSDMILQPLPVELLEFQAVMAGDDVKLYWSTASETNLQGFEIERSYNLNEWQKIGFVAGSGYSNSMLMYSHLDVSPFYHQHTAYYRLRMVDLDRTISYSEIKSVTYSDFMSENISLSPNPANDVIRISGVTSEFVYEIFIYNSSGSLMHSGFYSEENEINISHLLPGLYHVLIIQKDTRVLNKTLVIL